MVKHIGATTTTIIIVKVITVMNWMRHLVLELMMMNSHRVIVSHAASTGVSKGRGRGRP